MTTYYDFVPTSQSPFQFQPTLDGAIYTVVVTWNVWDPRWYFNVYALSGDLIVALPVVASPVGLNLQSVAWLGGEAAVATLAPHGLRIGDSVDLTVAGCAPDAYDGTARMLVTGPGTLSYPLSADPGEATVLGSVGKNVNLLAGYFSSTMVFRDGTNQFEVSP